MPNRISYLWQKSAFYLKKIILARSLGTIREWYLFKQQNNALWDKTLSHHVNSQYI
jgi:hypothetical protein